MSVCLAQGKVASQSNDPVVVDGNDSQFLPSTHSRTTHVAHLRRTWSLPRRPDGTINRLLFALCIFTLASLTARAQDVSNREKPYDNPSAQLQDFGHRIHFYGSEVDSPPTSSGVESKLWWNDGTWWGSFYNPAVRAYHIYRLDTASQTWADTGTALDDRAGSRADVLWDDANQKLYVVSHIFQTIGQPSELSSQWGRLYRFTFAAPTKAYTLDPGFPVTVTRGIEQALTITRDSRGILWVTYVENNQVFVNHSTASDLEWSTPFRLPSVSPAEGLTGEDLSTVIALQGNKIGVMWSNRAKGTFSFAAHNDGDADTVWQPAEIALGGVNSACSHNCSLPYMNLKTDSAGRVFAAVVTGPSSRFDAPRTLLLVRDARGSWSSYVYGMALDDHAGPILLLDEEAGRIHMFATSPATGGTIYEKTSDLNNIQFPIGLGNAFIQSSTDPVITDASSTKQVVSGSTGLVVQASDPSTRFYLQNTLTATVAPTISSFTPTNGSVGTKVTIDGSGFTGTNAVAFNGTPAVSFTVVTDAQITAKVPIGATSGLITVSNGIGTATSATSFAVTPNISSFTPASGILGTPVTITGNNFTSATKVTFAGTPATFTVVSDTQITTSVPAGATTGKIKVTTPQGSGASPTAFTVLSAGAPTITLFSPLHAPVGAVISVTGTNFTGTTAVAFNGTAAASFTVNTDTQLSARVSSGATSGPIIVTNTVGTAASATSFVVTPNLISFTPGSGTPGTPVTITGTSFTGATAVTFNGTAASFTVVSDSQITTSVPAAASTGKIKVTTPQGASTSATAFTVLSAGAPSITQFLPASAPVGTVISITGANFTGTSKVTFNGTAAASFTVNTDTQLSAKVPSGATSGPIAVTNTVGTTASTTSFTVLPNIVSFLPASGSVGTPVTITGTSFTGANAVSFNGTAASFTVVSDSQITTTVPAGALTGKLKVTTPQGTATSATAFTVTSATAPTITLFSPTSGPVGDNVTITGTNFTGATAVAFNGKAASFTVVSDTQITTSVPAGATSGPIAVTNNAGTTASSTSFTVVPAILSFSPGSGVLGTPITITGTSFTGANKVTFAGTPAIFTVISDTQITATVPGGSVTGKIKITTPLGIAVSPTAFTVLSAGAPTITLFSPTSGPVGTSITLAGTNFTGVTAVLLNGTPVNFSVNSDTHIGFKIPTGATSGPLTVTNSVGTIVSAVNFTVM